VHAKKPEKPQDDSCFTLYLESQKQSIEIGDNLRNMIRDFDGRQGSRISASDGKTMGLDFQTYNKYNVFIK